MTKGQYISTQSLFHGIYPPYLPGNLTFLDHFVCWQMSQLVTYFWTDSLTKGSVKMLEK